MTFFISVEAQNTQLRFHMLPFRCVWDVTPNKYLCR